jgi:hypothetical protein
VTPTLASTIVWGAVQVDKQHFAEQYAVPGFGATRDAVRVWSNTHCFQGFVQHTMQVESRWASTAVALSTLHRIARWQCFGIGSMLGTDWQHAGNGDQ